MQANSSWHSPSLILSRAMDLRDMREVLENGALVYEILIPR